MSRRDGEGLTLFDTALGRMGLAWTPRGLDRVVLPGEDPQTALGLLQEHAPGRALLRRVDEPLRGVAERIQAHLEGRLDPLDDIALDLSSRPPFARRVYRALRRVRPGEVTSYAGLAQRVGKPGAARAVGQAMANNPLPLVVPCHRVLTAQRKLGGFSSAGGVALKARLLFVEGVVLDERHADGIRALKGADPKLSRIISRVGPYLPRLGPAAKAYDALVESIIYQQLSMRAASTIASRVRALGSGGRYPNPLQIKRIRDATLRRAGLSRQKISYLRDLARRVADGSLPLNRLRRLTDEQVIEALSAVRGIGRWSVQMFLIFHLGRLDVLPVDDLGLRKAVARVYGLGRLADGAQIERLAERWRPYRSLATWYLWRSAEAGGL